MADKGKRSNKTHIIPWRAIREFLESHPEDPSALGSFSEWYDMVENSPFANFNEVKSVFPTASLVDDLIVFNIGGNKYRLTTWIIYKSRKIYIRRIMTHAEYNKGGWRE